jgi:hypothetical protein
MEYKGYKFNLCGVYTVRNRVKLYSLEIFQGDTQIFKSDYVYENEKRAFKDAKEMIRKKRFDSEIIKKNTYIEVMKTDTDYKYRRINKIANGIIISTLLLAIVTFIIMAFGINKIDDNISMFGYFFVGLGLFMSLIMIYYGIFAKGGFELNGKQIKIYKLIWWANLLLNKGPVVPYNEQPFENKKKGWYNSSIFITMLFEVLPSVFLISDAIIYNHFGLVFYGVIITYILLLKLRT